MEELHSPPLNVYPFVADAMPLPYNTQPCSAVDDLDNTKEAEMLVPPRYMMWEGLVMHMNMSKPIWMEDLILMLAKMCTKSSLIMMDWSTIQRS